MCQKCSQPVFFYVYSSGTQVYHNASSIFQRWPCFISTEMLMQCDSDSAGFADEKMSKFNWWHKKPSCTMRDKYEMDIIHIYAVDKFKVFINRIYIFFCMHWCNTFVMTALPQREHTQAASTAGLKSRHLTWERDLNLYICIPGVPGRFFPRVTLHLMVFHVFLRTETESCTSVFVIMRCL